MGLRLLFALLSVSLAADLFAASLSFFDEQVYSAVSNLSSQVADLSVQVAGLTNLVFQGSSVALNQALMFLLKVIQKIDTIFCIEFCYNKKDNLTWLNI